MQRPGSFKSTRSRATPSIRLGVNAILIDQIPENLIPGYEAILVIQHSLSCYGHCCAGISNAGHVRLDMKSSLEG